MSYDVYVATRLDLNMVLMALAGIVFIGSIAVLLAKRKGKKFSCADRASSPCRDSGDGRKPANRAFQEDWRGSRARRNSLVLGQSAESEVDQANDDNEDDDFRKADGEVTHVHCGSIRWFSGQRSILSASAFLVLRRPSDGCTRGTTS
jgi:hypothetical protein